MATATLMPNPRFVVVDANGDPISGAMVHTYIPGGTVAKTSWQDVAETIPNSNPIICDAAGSCIIYGSGSYQLTVTDANGVAIPGYSGVTADTFSGALTLITAETARATAAEVAITAAVTAETARATAAEALLGKFVAVNGPAGAARLFFVNYTNTSGRPMFVSITGANAAATTLVLTVSGLQMDTIAQSTFPSSVAVRGMVPVGAIYRAETTTPLTSVVWLETV